jgi:CheY-like chemotaxis protein
MPAGEGGHEPLRTVIWVLDDIEANHDFVRRSLPEGYESVCVFKTFVTAEDALRDLEKALDAIPEELPDVLFMDFFLGDDHGDEVTERIRAAFSAKRLTGPFIVGHSSSTPASLEILKKGGDIAIEKDRRTVHSRGVRRLFPDLAAIHRYAGRARGRS